MLRRAMRAFSTVVVVWAIGLAGVLRSPHDSSSTVLPIEPIAADSGPAGALAIAAVKSAVAEPGRFVSIVAADIDADGDLDVVASDSTLQLHVWVNDGSGHFTTRQPEKSTAWRDDPNPSYDTGSGRSETSTQTDPPSLRFAGRTFADIRGASARAAERRDRALRTTSVSASGPRAPPLSLI